MKKLFFILFFCALCINNFAQDEKGYWDTYGNSGTDKSNFIGTTDCMPLIFKTNNTDRMKLLSDKSFLGIGLTTPKATLHLHYQTDPRPCEDMTSLGRLTKLLQITTSETGMNDNNGFGVYYSNAKDLLLKQQEMGKITIAGPGGGLSIEHENGYVGIGTDQPQAPLHINYQVESSRIPNPSLFSLPLLKVGTSTANAGFGIYGFSNSNNINIQQNEPASLKISGYISSLSFASDGNISVSIPSQAKFDVYGLFSAQNATISGNLGLGTIAPEQKLHVVGNSYFKGNVGIETTSPQAKLDVNGSFKAQNATIAETITGNQLNAKSANFSESISVNSGIQTLSLGNAYHADLNWGTSYIGFNAKRNNGNWTLSGGGTNNGGAVIWATVDGSLLFASIPKTGGSTQTLTDTQIKENVKLYLTPTGVLKAKEVLVSATGWPDYVFDKDYKLLSLNEVEKYIDENQHLPNVPSAVEVESNGIQLGEMNAILIRKVEELTLYVLDLQKQINALKN